MTETIHDGPRFTVKRDAEATDIELLDEAISELAAALAANSATPSFTLGSLPAAEPK